MAMKKFRGQLTVDFEIEVDDSVIERCLNDAEWRQNFYQFNTPEEVAGNLAYNLVHNTSCLSNLDGFADMDDDLLKLKKERWDDTDVEQVGKRRKAGSVRYDKVKPARRRKAKRS